MTYYPAIFTSADLRLMGNLSFDLCYLNACMKFKIMICFRSYVKGTINGSEILSGRVQHAYFHKAVLNDNLASCLTYIPQHRVPPGEQHSVTENRSGKFSLIIIGLFQNYSWACISTPRIIQH